MKAPKKPGHPVHSLIEQRWSPRAFARKAISPEHTNQLFEAARWAASSRNVQPWRFIIAHAAEANDFEGLINCMLPGNREWCRHAALVGLASARLNFEHADIPNAHAFYDVGQAMAFVSLQAMHLGIGMHQIAGFDPLMARQVAGVPQNFEPVCMFVLGYFGDPQELPEELRLRELRAQTRKPLGVILAQGKWSNLIPDEGGVPLY